MLKAIHKQTGNIVSAFKVENDASWIGKEKDEWVAPRTIVFDYKEKGDVKVFFTKSHIRDGVPVRCHFKHESDREVYDAQSESKEHRMAKEGVYEAICNGDIKIEGVPLKNLIEDIEFEYPISNSKKAKIADVITIFKQWHPIYGKGIIFEVQFSNQSSEVTEARTYHRVSEGYSVCWLWDGDFNENKLKFKNFDGSEHPITIIPFAKAIEDYQIILERITLSKINEAGLLLDKKINLLNNKYNNFEEDLANKSATIIDTISDGFRLELSEIDSHIKSKIDSVKEIIKKEKDADIRFLFKNAISELQNEFKETLKTDLLNSYNWTILQNKIIEELKYSVGKEIRDYILKESKETLLAQSKIMIEKSITENLSGDNVKEIIKNTINEKIGSAKIEITSLCTCKKCNNQFPIKSMEYESGWAYCSKCFDSLEDNWRKRREMRKDGGNKIN